MSITTIPHIPHIGLSNVYPIPRGSHWVGIQYSVRKSEQRVSALHCKPHLGKPTARPLKTEPPVAHTNTQDPYPQTHVHCTSGTPVHIVACRDEYKLSRNTSGK